MRACTSIVDRACRPPGSIVPAGLPDRVECFLALIVSRRCQIPLCSNQAIGAIPATLILHVHTSSTGPAELHLYGVRFAPNRACPCEAQTPCPQSG